MASKNNIDMTDGPLLPQLVAFAVPLMLSTLLQMVFNTADLIVVGRFCDHRALAAVGASGALYQIIIGTFLGLSGGASVVAANAFGAKNVQRTTLTVHTSIAIALYGGIVLGIVTPFFIRPLMLLLKTPPEVLDGAVLYMQIICCSIPFIALYNFGSSLLRSFGDSKSPMYYLAISGVLNVVLNLIFVIVFHMKVEGVALATVIAQILSAALVIRNLVKINDPWRLQTKNFRIDPRTLKSIFSLGFPSGIQTSCFALTNMLIQSSVNSLGEMAMAGHTASANIEAYVSIVDIAGFLVAMSFVGQNNGARKYHRLCRGIKYNLYCCLGATFALSMLVLAFGRPLLSIYNNNPEVIEWGHSRMVVMMTSFVTVVFMDNIAGALRGLEHPWMPMITTLVGVCGFRTLWILLVFNRNRTMEHLMMSYPFSWSIVAVVTGIYLVWECRRLLRRPDCAD